MYIRVKPWGGNAAGVMTESDYFDIEYIGFFKSEDDAKNYDYALDGSVDKTPDTPNEPENPEDPKYVIGDVDNDGKVTSIDLLVLSRYLAKWSGYEALPFVSENEN